MLDFINSAWTPWHAVAAASSRLTAAGFQHIAEKGKSALHACGISGVCTTARCQLPCSYLLATVTTLYNAQHG